MPTEEQKTNLRRLQDELRQRPDVGPVTEGPIGRHGMCWGNRFHWLVDISTMQAARALAKKSDRRCRPPLKAIGLPIGPTRRDPIRDHYGITDEQAARIEANDFRNLPGPEDDGRAVWLERQLGLIDEIIGQREPPRPISTHRDRAMYVVMTTAPEGDPEPEIAAATGAR